MIDFITYEFDSNLYDLYPVIPDGFAYTVKDVSGSNGIITRTLSCEDDAINDLTIIQLGATTATDRERSLLKVLNIFANKVTSMNYMFANCSALTSLDLSSFNTSNVTNMQNMFSNCSSLTSLDLSGFNTSKTVSMSNMFYNCSALTSLDLSSFNTSNVTNMQNMFANCTALTSLDLSGFNTSKAANMQGMFYNCTALTSLDLSGFNTSNVTNMQTMFYNCTALTSLDLSGFNTSKTVSMNYMFYTCTALTSLDLSGFDTGNVTNMQNMFANCRSLTSLDLSGFDTGNVTNMQNMFANCTALTSIYMLKSNPNTINDIIYYTPTKDAVSYGEIFVSDNYDVSLINIKDANIKNWNLVIFTDAIATSTIKNVSHQYMKITNIAFGLKNAIKKISMFSTDLSGDHRCTHETYTGYPIIAEGDICEVHESYLMELYGNTIQDINNLADIRSVGILQSDGSYKVDLMISNPSKGRRMKSILLPQPLYSVNGYADRLFWDETTHQYYIEQRVIKLVLDGSSKWMNNAYDDILVSMYIRVDVDYKLPKATNRLHVISDTLPTQITGVSNVNRLEGVGFNASGSNLIFDVRTSTCYDPAIDAAPEDGFYRWINANPITVYYSMQEPIMVPIDITKQISFTAFDQLTQINTDEKEAVPSNMSVQIPIRKG